MDMEPHREDVRVFKEDNEGPGVARWFFVCASTSWERRKARGGSGGGAAGQEEVGELGLQG
jgi:hypothetical protein